MRKTLKEMINCANKTAKRRAARLINVEKRPYLKAVDDSDLDSLRADFAGVIKRYEVETQRLELDVFDAKQEGEDAVETYKHDISVLEQEISQLRREMAQDLWDSKALELDEWDKRELRSKYREEYLSQLPAQERERRDRLDEEVRRLSAENEQLREVIERLMSEYGVKEVSV